jgi:hypothetical protein
MWHPNAITPAHLSQFTTALMHRHTQSIASIHANVRSFLRFLNMKELHEKDLSSNVPRFKSSYGTRVSFVWEEGDE